MRDYEPYYTEDGSIGLYSYADKDVFHSKFGALTEAWEKFVVPSKIENILQHKNNLKVLDICYGIGYNTKALMSYIINLNSQNLKRKNFLFKITYLVSIYTNNILNKIKRLLGHIESIDDNNIFCSEPQLPQINIDCLDINSELVKLSPFFKTIKTSEEIYSEIVPDVFKCFDFYYKFKDLFINIADMFYPQNKKEIKELLDIKFKNMHIDKEYKVNGLVNYFILNKLFNDIDENLYSKEFKKIVTNPKILRFIDKSMIKYAQFNQNFGYKTSSKSFLSAFLHNIYYGYLSKRYKNIDFKTAESMFKLNFYINDARKTILHLKNKYDCIYLDAFTYTKAPQLWSLEFIAVLYDLLSDDGVLLTYSNSAQIRNTLLENKFYVGKIFDQKSGKFIGTIASKDKSKIEYPLNNYEIGLCGTKAGIPYHDPNLSFSAREILEFREYEFNHSTLMSSSKYMKIRSMRGNNG